MFDEKTVNIYSSRDNIRNELIEYLKEYLELESIDLNKTSPLSYLINILSVLTTNLIFYSSSIYKESFMTKAVQKESVLSLAAFLGYSPNYAVSSRVNLLIEMPTSFKSSVSVEIPKNFQYSAGDIVFSQNSSITVQVNKDVNGNTINISISENLDIGGSQILKHKISTNDKGLEYVYFSVPCTQVEYIEQEYTIPELKAFEFHRLAIEFDGQLSALSLSTTDSLTGNELLQQEWRLYDSLFLIPYNSAGFTFRQGSKGGEISFGNGVIGKQAPSRHVIKLTIGVTKGASGNVIAGSVKKADRLYVQDYDDKKNKNVIKPIKLNVVNTSPSSGGQDSPTIDEIRSSAIANISTLHRLVSKYDYENINNIIPGLPAEHTIDILKRSDIKQNEICLYNNILFGDSIVPTRNAIWTLDGSNDYIIYTSDTIDIDDISYYSLFNIEIDTQQNECKYFHLIDNLEKSLTLTRTYESITRILPSYIEFQTIIRDPETGLNLNPGLQKINLNFHYQKVIQDDYSALQCSIIDWEGKTHGMVHDQTDVDVPFFSYEFNLPDIPDGPINFYFKQYELLPDPDNPGEYLTTFINETYVEVIIKKDLSAYMLSQIEVIDLGDDNYHVTIHDVPVIRKDYYDSIDKNTFLLDIYEKIIGLNIEEFRMLTDFVNVKFSDTTGKLENMKYNKTTKNPVLSINPTTLPTLPENGDRYVVIDLAAEDFDKNPWNKVGSFIAEYKSSVDEWVYEQLNINDYFYVESESKKLLFNGKRMIYPVTTIPLQIDLIVWKDLNLSSTSAAIIHEIKNELIDKLYPKFGFDKNLYLSEIIDIVQTVPGVRHCEVVNPKFDIFFDYDIHVDITQEELLDYTPQMIVFSTADVSVEMR